MTTPTIACSQSTTLRIAYLASEVGIPVLIWSRPGRGKSSLVRGLAKHAKRHLETVLASLKDPTEFGGMPHLLDDCMSYAPPAWAHRLRSSERGMLFLDEVNQSRPATQATLMSVVHDRMVGECFLGDGTAVIACANPLDGGATGGWPMGESFANRLMHVSLASDVDAWRAGMIQGWGEPDLGAVLPADWRTGIPAAQALVASFIGVRPSLLEGEMVEGAYATPRTWTMSSHFLAACRAAGYDVKTSDVVALGISGLVGADAAIEFLAWVATQDLIDPELVLADPLGCALPTRGDRLAAVLDATAAAALAERPDRKARFAAAWTVLKRIVDAGQADVPVPAAMALATAGRRLGLVTPKEATAFATLLKQAGLS